MCYSKMGYSTKSKNSAQISSNSSVMICVLEKLGLENFEKLVLKLDKLTIKFKLNLKNR